MTESEFTWEAALELVDWLVYQKNGIHLRDIEITVLKASWEGATYMEMADTYGYSPEYLNKDIGYKLWHKVTEAVGTGDKLTKQNFKEALKRVWKQHKSDNFINTKEPILTSNSVYIERPPLEANCFAEIMQPGCLLRIKAPLQMGKTELKSKILDYAVRQNYRTVQLNLRDATATDFSQLDLFLQWLCTAIAESLQLNYPVTEHWHKSLGNTKIKCRTYFEKYLLPQNNPLVLAVDEVDKLFPYREVTGEFLGMLRTWHEDAKTRPLWQQLRLIVLHTQTYTELDINQSPFNAGTEINLPDFTAEQILSLAKQYGLDWDSGCAGHTASDRVVQLMNLVGGHPFLVGEAIEQVVRENLPLAEVLETATTTWGIYRYHLQKQWQNLLANPQLSTAFHQVVLSDNPVEFNSVLNQDVAVKLNDLGLVKLDRQSAIPRYKLYHLYFRQRYQENDI